MGNENALYFFVGWEEGDQENWVIEGIEDRREQETFL